MSSVSGIGRVILAGILCAATTAFCLFAKDGPAQGAIDVNPIGVSPEVTFDADFSPRQLPRTTQAAIALTIANTVGTSDGSHPPALEELALTFGRNSSIDGSALPTCGGGFRDVARTLEGIKEICEDAIVGAGRVGFEIAFPELAPTASKGPLVVFNGEAERDRTTLYAVGQATGPTGGMIVMPIEIRKRPKSRAGTEAVLTVPKVAGGSGSITDLSLTLRRRIAPQEPADRGMAGVVSLGCPDGRFLIAMRARFADGTLIVGTAPLRCRAEDMLGWPDGQLR